MVDGKGLGKGSRASLNTKKRTSIIHLILSVQKSASVMSTDFPLGTARANEWRELKRAVVLCVKGFLPISRT